MTRQEKKEELIGLFAVGAIFIGDLIDECFEFGQQHPRWISVEDKLPLYGQQVLAYSEHATDYGIWWSWRDSEGGDFLNLDINGFLTLCNDDNEPIQVTHWLPLPQPPIVSKSGNAHIIGTADHIKTALDVMEKKGGEE